MNTRTLLVLGLAWCLVGTAGAALAQQPSLAEVARQEAARRKNVQSGKRVYTNQDLEKGRPLTTGAVAKAAPPAEAAAPEAGPSAVAPSANPGESNEPAATDDPDVMNLRLALAAATESSRNALGEVDTANVTILNLFDEAQRIAAVATRDARLADYRKHQAEIDALSRQIADRDVAQKKAKAAKTP